MRTRNGWGPGPVFAWEWSAGSRRWQWYAVRVLFGAVLLASVWGMWASFQGSSVSLSDLGRVGEQLYYVYVLAQLVLIALVTPAATAGEICQEKAAGNLLHLLTTDLTDGEIVRGKLLARLIPVGMLMAAGLPILMICGLLGGLDLNAVIGATAVTAGMALLCCSGALLISVWARKPHRALVAAYFALFGWLVLLPIGEVILAFIVASLKGSTGPPWMPAIEVMFGRPGMTTYSIVAMSHPAWLAIAPYRAPGMIGMAEQFRFLGIAALISASFAAIATRAMRRVYLRQLGRPPKATKYLRMPSFGRKRNQGLGGRGLLPGPTLDGNPVLWREWHRNAPSLAYRMMGHAFLILSVVMFLPVLVEVITPSMGMMGMGPMLGFVHGFTITFGMLLLSVSSSTSMAEERARGSLDILLSTPLPTSQIVWGKWWGAFRGVFGVAALPTLVCLILAARTLRPIEPLLTVALILSWGALITSIGLALATWQPKQARAVGFAVAAYAGLTIGWPLLIAVSGIGARWDTIRRPYYFMLEAPWYGSWRLIDPIAGGNLNGYSYGLPHDDPEPGLLAWAVVWIGLNFVGSAALVGATLRTFNRSLGRVDEAEEDLGKLPEAITPG